MPRTPYRPAALACDTCRSRHLRCDGARPCNRCSKDSSSECSYTPSRRGLTKRSNKRAPVSQTVLTPISPKSATESVGIPTTAPPAVLEIIHPLHPPQQPATSSSGSQHVQHWSEYGGAQDRMASSEPQVAAAEYDMRTPRSINIEETHSRTQDSYLVDLYYANFHPSHPFLTARSCYDTQGYPDALHAIVCWIGQRYCHVGIEADLLALLEEQVFPYTSQQRHASAYSVQTLLLAAILLHSNCHPKEAKSCVDLAMEMAIRCGMHFIDFADIEKAYGGVESLRRTWWELYIIDIYLSALHRRRSYHSRFPDDGCHPYLPSDTDDASDLARTALKDFDNRMFLFTPRRFSTYCYRIEAIRIVQRIRFDEQALDPVEVQAIDNALMSWKHNLPSHLQIVMNSHGVVDPQLMQAHYIIACASILLHFPRSDLPSTVPATASITGAKEYVALMPASPLHRHKAIAASTDICNLAAVPWPTEQQSPLFACAVILGCIVQLAAASMHMHEQNSTHMQQYRARVVLMMGLLKSMSVRWQVASTALDRLKPIAAVIFIAESDMPGSEEPSSEDFESVTWMDLFEPDAFLH